MAAEAPNAVAVVAFEPVPGQVSDEPELFVEDVLAPAESEYFELRTTGPEPDLRPASALSYTEVLDKLEALANGKGSKEVFWVSGLIRVPATADQDLSEYAIRLALPIIKIAADAASTRIAFVAEGSPNRTT